MMRTPDVRSLAAALALVVCVVLAAFLALEYPEYRSTLVVARQTPSHEAIDGLFIGHAVMWTFAYELIAATVVIQALAAVALLRRWRLLLPVASLALFLCAVPQVLVGTDARSPVLFFAAGSNVVLGLLSAAAFGRRPAGPAATPARSLIVFAAAASLLATASPVAAAQAAQGSGSGIAYAQVTARQTGIQFPRLTSFKDAAVLSSVNRQLDAIAATFGCHLSRPQKGTGYKVRSQVEYADRDVFSIYASASYDCGGPYPTNDRNSSVTFDLRTGRLVRFESLFRNFATDKRAILETIFRKHIDRAAAAAAANRPNDGACDADPTLFSVANLESSTFAFTFTSAGLKVQPEWPHAVEACAEAVVVPYGALARFAAVDGILERVSK
jgi:hypothetical protein